MMVEVELQIDIFNSDAERILKASLVWKHPEYLPWNIFDFTKPEVKS